MDRLCPSRRNIANSLLPYPQPMIELRFWVWAMNSRDAMDKLSNIANEIRSMIKQAFPNGESNGSCLHCSIALWAAITNFTDLKARVHGGGAGHGGMIGSDCKLHPHYWVQVVDADDTLICDISADQFGHPAVIVAPKSSPIGQLYYPSEQNEIDIAASAVASSLGLKYPYPS